MHFRISTKKSPAQTYHYGQIVESYRRDDGMPAHRIMLNLGRLPLPLLERLALSFKSFNQGEALVLESEVAALVSGSTRANLRYLDLAVLRDVWDQWGIDQILDELAGPSDALLRFSDSVLALVLQRCCAPDSKLAATRWVPTTALPELLGFAPPAFHNTRVHRVLDELYTMTGRLQDRLVAASLRQSGRFQAVFMDVTDTYFEGIGAPMAELTRTKSEMPNKRCLGVVLLVNQEGFPLRWKVVGGKTKDWTAMSGLLRDIGQVPWLKHTLIVFDRAMGNRTTVAELKEAGLHFLTAAHRNAIDSFTTALPVDTFADLALGGTDASYEDDIARVAEAARKAGLVEIHERLFVSDLGVCVPESDRAIDQPSTDPDAPVRHPRPGVAHQLQRARDFAKELAADPSLRQADLAKRHGVSAGRVGQLLALLRLHPELLQRVEALGEGFPFSEKYCWTLLRLPADQQLAALEADLAALTAPTKPAESLGSLRMVAYFNPQLFVDTRRRTADHCVQLQARVDELNAELAQSKRSRKQEATYRKFSREVERLNYLDAFDIALVPISVASGSDKPLSSFRGTITRKEAVWARRRRYDGFVLLLGHPELPQTGVALVDAYRSKDAVEKGFQSIKSVAELRPIFHYRDPTVQAHVTLCILALLLMRALEKRFRDGGVAMTASACIATLAPAHLNLRSPPSGKPIYDITRPNTAQREILSTLRLLDLAEDRHLRPRLTPREVTD